MKGSRGRPRVGRRAAALVVLALLWLALLSRLGEVSPPGALGGAAVEAVAERVPPTPTLPPRFRLGLYQGDERVGSVATLLQPDGDGFVLRQETHLRLRVLAEQREVRTRLTARLDADYGVQSSLQEIESEGARFRGALRREGGVLHYDAGFASDRTQGEVEIGAGEVVHLPATARLVLARQLAVGRRLELSVFDPLVLRFAPLVLEVRGIEPLPHDPTRSAWRVDETLRGLRASVWIDAEGRVWAEETVMGFRARAEGAGATTVVPALAALDIEAHTGIPVGVVPDARERAELRLRLGGVAAGRIPRGAAQDFEGEWLVLRRVEPNELGSFRLPYRFDDDVEAHLQPDTWIQSDHPRIRALAAEVIGDATDAWVAAERLLQWVFAYLEKTPTLGVPSALEALDAGRGDCNEHAVLFTALARAAGLPSRVVAGLVYADGRFVYHAWSEVRGQRGWLPVDPALGQFPADATHLALAHGELWDVTGWADMVGVLELELAPP